MPLLGRGRLTRLSPIFVRPHSQVSEISRVMGGKGFAQGCASVGLDECGDGASQRLSASNAVEGKNDQAGSSRIQLQKGIDDEK